MLSIILFVGSLFTRFLDLWSSLCYMFTGRSYTFLRVLVMSSPFTFDFDVPWRCMVMLCFSFTSCCGSQPFLCLVDLGVCQCNLLSYLQRSFSLLRRWYVVWLGLGSTNVFSLFMDTNVSPEMYLQVSSI